MNVTFPTTAIFDAGEPRRWLGEEVLPEYVRGCRWFGGKAREAQRFEIAELLRLPSTGQMLAIALVRVSYREGAEELYQLPLSVLPGEQAREIAAEFPSSVIAQVADSALCDGIYDPIFRDTIVRIIAESQHVAGGGGELLGTAGVALPELLGGALPLPSRVLGVEQSNSSVLYGSGLFLKIVRKLEEGVNPDAEILRFLTERCAFAHAPSFGGLLEFRSADREGRLLALATSVVPNEGDAWAFTLRELDGFLDRALRVEAAPASQVFGCQTGDALLRETVGESFLQRAAQLGRRTGEMHVALASVDHEPEFAPEPLNTADLRELQAAIEKSLSAMLALAEGSTLGPATRVEVARLLHAAPALRALAGAVVTEPISAAKTRHHGDFHLGQVLNTGADFVIIDFEGEPARSLTERRRKRSPLRDIAGMLRSYHYAAHCAIRAHAGDPETLLQWGEQWSRLVGGVFLAAWTEATIGAPFIPGNARHSDELLSAYLLEKALYEVSYELNNRPNWVGIPISGLLRLATR